MVCRGTAVRLMEGGLKPSMGTATKYYERSSVVSKVVPQSYIDTVSTFKRLHGFHPSPCVGPSPCPIAILCNANFSPWTVPPYIQISCSSRNTFSSGLKTPTACTRSHQPSIASRRLTAYGATGTPHQARKPLLRCPR